LQERALDERLASLEATGIAVRVAEAIVARLPLGEPRRADVAAGLGLTDRTLQRRLQVEHTSFQQVLDDARRTLARRYLADRRYPLAQVAHLVGFSDESNFFRACKRWFGMPPGQVREAQQGTQPPP
jgi:AraC-like DNA-binding protein